VTLQVVIGIRSKEPVPHMGSFWNPRVTVENEEEAAG